MSLKPGELIVHLWSDYEPHQGEWGDWSDKDFWRSARDKGFPARSVEIAESLFPVQRRHNAPITWGIFSCEPFFEWIQFLSDFLAKVTANGDNITVHPHWLDWDNGWTRCRAPNEKQILRSLGSVSILSKYSSYFPMIRSGWQTQTTKDGTLLRDVYNDFEFVGIGDVPKKDKEYVRLQYSNRKTEFLSLPYDTDSMDDCMGKWKRAFTPALERAKTKGAIFSWWFHVHEINANMLEYLLSGSEKTAAHSGVKIKYVNLKTLYSICTE